MKAVILAAGIGSRLTPITVQRHKSCVTVGREPILRRQLRAFEAAGVTDVTVVTGYLSDQVTGLCTSFAADRDGFAIHTRKNEVYANTNNMYSLSLARDAVGGEPFLLANGDVVLEGDAVTALLDADAQNAIACDTSTYSGEGMKVTVDDAGRVDHIAKDVPESEAHATSIDLYRFSASFSRKLFAEIQRRVDVESGYDDWTEVAIDALLGGAHPVEPVDVAGTDWVEVDDLDDLLTADRTFSPLDDLRSKEAVFFDLDGTLYLDDEPVDGAAEVVADLRAGDTDVYFLSNNSSRWKTDYVTKLAGLGIDAEGSQVVLSTDGVIDYLTDDGVEECYVVGTASMREAIDEAGVDVTATDPEAVVVGFDTELTYEKVRRATLAIRDGAEFLLAHPDLVCPTAEGLVPDCGSIGALVEAAAGRAPTRVFGKPHAEMIAPVLEEEGLSPGDVAVVGDRLETDVRLAENVGCDSVCVLTGDADRAAVEAHELSPTLVVPSVGAFRRPGATTGDETGVSEAVQETD